MFWFFLILVGGFLLYTYIRARVRMSYAKTRRNIRTAQEEALVAIQTGQPQQPSWFNKDMVVAKEFGKQCALAAKRGGMTDQEVERWLANRAVQSNLFTIAAKYENQGMPRSEQIVATSDDVEKLVRSNRHGLLADLDT
jgi:hypothetical protein